MITGMEQPIEAPRLAKRQWGLLLDATDPIMVPARAKVVAEGAEPQREPIPAEQLARGVTFTPLGVEALERLDSEFCDDTADGSLVDPGDRPKFEAFSVRSQEACSALDVDLAWLNGRIAKRWEPAISDAVAAELAMGGNTVQTPTLSGSATFDSAASVEIGYLIPSLEERLADMLRGAAGMIHLPPLAFAVATQKDWVDLHDGIWWTRSGHAVISDSGYLGMYPEGEGVTATTGWGFASGWVSAAVAPPRQREQSAVEYLDRTRNIITGRSIAEAVYAFDPSTVAAVEFETASGS